MSSDVYISDEEDYATQVSPASVVSIPSVAPVQQRVAPQTTSPHNLPPHIPPRVNDVKMEYVVTSFLTCLSDDLGALCSKYTHPRDTWLCVGLENKRRGHLVSSVSQKVLGAHRHWGQVYRVYVPDVS